LPLSGIRPASNMRTVASTPQPAIPVLSSPQQATVPSPWSAHALASPTAKSVTPA
jgi:hypothetical protein